MNFGDENIVCFIGRGDSGKTTVLEAISSALSSSWNLTFHDSDFYNCDTTNPISIEVSLIDIPEKLLSDDKYGLYIRCINVDTNEIIDDILLDETIDNSKPILTIRLEVDKALEPKWTVVNTRAQDEKQISATDRASLNCTMVLDYVDKHFSWSKGSSLHSLLRETSNDVQKNNIIIESLRQAKEKIDQHDFSELESVTNIIKKQASTFGLNISDAHSTLDFKELSLKDSRISLHENFIPFSAKGKGSRRLASFAIQSALLDRGGMMLVDEVEQGLEPDRTKRLIRALIENDSGQIILTTHSREVITELGSNSLFLFLKFPDGSKVEARQLLGSTDSLQKAVRACPEAFFAKKIIMCEGATEVGICRAMDMWRVKNNKEPISFRDSAYVDGTGSTLIERAREIHLAGIKTALFCDSDDKPINENKPALGAIGIQIFDCEIGNCIEEQAFSDLPWNAVQKLINYALKNHYNGNHDSMLESINAKYAKHLPSLLDFKDDSHELRKALTDASVSSTKTRREWFKSVHDGEELGNIIFEYIQHMDATRGLRKTIEDLSDWIDK